jgi:hypothetical protein
VHTQPARLQASTLEADTARYPACSYNGMATCGFSIAQGLTILLLKRLVQGCALRSPGVLHSMLYFAQMLSVAELRQRYSLLTVELMARLREAADAGYFSDPASSLASKAADVAYGILGTMSAPPILSTWFLADVLGNARS